MEVKKKLIVVLSSFCGVLLALVIAMGIVWAATSQTITSAVKVTYTAVDVAGSISANVYFGSDTPVPMSGGTNGTVTFDPSQSVSGTLTPQSDTVLVNESGQQYVIYEYIITNASGSIMSAVLTYTDSTTSPNIADANIKVYEYESVSSVTNPKTNVATLYGVNDANKLLNTTGQFVNAQIASQTTKHFYIVVGISNLAFDAEFSGEFGWVLGRYVAS